MSCHQLELQSGFSRGIGQRLDAAVVQIAAAIEDHFLDSLFLGALGDQLADLPWRRRYCRRWQCQPSFPLDEADTSVCPALVSSITCA